MNDPFGEPLTNPVIGEQAGLNVNSPEQSTETLIRSNFNGVFSYTLRKNKLSITTFYEELDFQLTGSNESSYGVDTTWDWNIGPRLNSVLSMGWSRNNLLSSRKDEFMNAKYQLTYRFAKTLTASIGASYVKKASTIVTAEYDENRLFISLNKMF